MRRYITREDAVFAACKALDKFGGCKMGALCPDVGCREVRDIIDTFQMIEIPEKHGRLIDADALDADLERQDMHTGEWDAVGFSIKERENAPTIIPAEESMHECFWGEEYAEAKGLTNL